MNDEQQLEPVRHANCSVAGFLRDTCVLDVNKAVEENLSSGFEIYAVFPEIYRRFLPVPNEPLIE